jgi:hypothetical protein
MFMEPRNRFQGMNSASLCSLAGRYDNSFPPRFLAPIGSLKFPALVIGINITTLEFTVFYFEYEEPTYSIAILPDSSWRNVEDWLNWAQQFPTGPLLLYP